MTLHFIEGTAAQSVERAVGAHSLLVGSLSLKHDLLRQKTWFPGSVSAWQYVKLSIVSLGTHLGDSLVDETDVKKVNKNILILTSTKDQSR